VPPADSHAARGAKGGRARKQKQRRRLRELMAVIVMHPYLSDYQCGKIMQPTAGETTVRTWVRMLDDIAEKRRQSHHERLETLWPDELAKYENR
jgi:hypothetical protein